MQRKLDKHMVLKGQRNLYHFSSTNAAQVVGIVMASTDHLGYPHAPTISVAAGSVCDVKGKTMIVVRRIIVGVLALLFMASGSSVFAAQGGVQQEIHSVDPVSFTMQPVANGSGCAQITTPVTAIGQQENDITVWTYPDGSRKVVHQAEAQGTAIDTNGKTYEFHYANKATYTVQPGGHVQVDMSDSFQLKGQGRTNRVNANFHWLWTYDLSDPSTIPTSANVSYPPVDNWVQLQTVGDPINCDPI
jgi:hypothetical protein